jgi:hypothetical protein
LFLLLLSSLLLLQGCVSVVRTWRVKTFLDIVLIIFLAVEKHRQLTDAGVSVLPEDGFCRPKYLGEITNTGGRTVNQYMCN